MPQNEQRRGLVNRCIDWLKRIFCHVVYDFSNVSDSDYNRVLQTRRLIGYFLFTFALCSFTVALYKYYDVIKEEASVNFIILTICLSVASFLFCVYLSGGDTRIHTPSRSLRLDTATTELRPFRRCKLSPIEEVSEKSSTAVSGTDPQLSNSEDPSGVVPLVSYSQVEETRSDSDAVALISKQIESPAKQLSGCDVPPDNQTPSTSGLQAAGATEESCKILSDK